MLDVNLLSKIATDMLYEKQNSKENPSENFGEYTKGALDLVAELEDYLVNDDEEKEVVTPAKDFFEMLGEVVKYGRIVVTEKGGVLPEDLDVQERYKERVKKLTDLYVSHGYEKVNGMLLSFRKWDEAGRYYKMARINCMHVKNESDEDFEKRMKFVEEKLNEKL